MPFLVELIRRYFQLDPSMIKLSKYLIFELSAQEFEQMCLELLNSGNVPQFPGMKLKLEEPNSDFDLVGE